jgi:hypothetical protein
VDRTFFQWLTGKEVKASRSSAASRSMTSSLGDWRPSIPGDDVELVVDMGGVRLGEAGPDGRGDHPGRALGHLGEHVSEEVDPTALEGRTSHDRADGLAQTEVGVGDDQLHPNQPTGLQAAQECRPVGTSSLSPTATPSTSRRPSPHTPVATTTAWATTRRLTRALQ